MVYSSNLTPDAATGLGGWTPAQFRRALHDGRSRDGRLLYPAFPYDAYTRISDEDADALFAFLRSLAPVAQANRAHALRFPYGTQVALAVWRALYFRAGRLQPEQDRSAAWNRGAYLVLGLGHCGACHAERNRLGAVRAAPALRGGLIALQNWWAPALGGAARPAAQLVELLKTGRSQGSATLGPMAEVVLHSTQHLAHSDLQAMATYLASLPPADAPAVSSDAADPARRDIGAKLYKTHCESCHGSDGQGVMQAYVPLAGNPAVMQDPPANVVQVLLGGAFAPSTSGNPRPFGMPPFANELSDDEIAAVASHIRNAWGNRAPDVRPQDLNRWRGSVRP
jgi:mono/diheme cytochrome c family protein